MLQTAPELIWDYSGDQNSPIFLNKRDTSYLITRRQVSYLLHNIDEIQKILHKEIRHIPESNHANNNEQLDAILPAKNYLQHFLHLSDKFPYIIIAIQVFSLILDTILIAKGIYEMPYVSLVSVCIESFLFLITFGRLILKLATNVRTVSCISLYFSAISCILIFASINSIINEFNINSWKYIVQENLSSDNLFVVIYIQMVYNCTSIFLLHSTGEMIPVTIPSYLSTIVLVMLSYSYLLINLLFFSTHCFMNSLNYFDSFRQNTRQISRPISAPIDASLRDPTGGFITPIGQSYVEGNEGYDHVIDNLFEDNDEINENYVTLLNEEEQLQ